MFQRLAARILSEAGLIARIARAHASPVMGFLACAVPAAALLGSSPASAAPYLVIDQDSGAVLEQQDATEPWYPASLTKLMTAYVVLDEIRKGRLSPDSLIVVSANAARQAPSKMGFRPGTTLTIDNALKMLLVKSANDIAVTIAEGVGGSVEGFAAKMNSDAQALGMADSHFENPNGLPNPDHHSSAQDLAILARALLTEFPDYRSYFGIGAISFGDHVYHTYNGLLGRYPGADGMKTGFICAGGFNTVVSATHGGRRLIAVVLGQPSASIRSVVTASLLDKAFASSGSGWTSPPKVTSLARIGGEPPDMRGEICGRHRGRRAVTWEQEVGSGSAACGAPSAPVGSVWETLGRGASTSCGDTVSGKTPSPTSRVAFDPITVYVGPGPNSGTAIQPPGTLATLRASPAVSGAASALAPPDGGEGVLDKVNPANGKPVRLHGVARDKPAVARGGRRGAKVAAKAPAEEVTPPVKPGKKAKATAAGKRKVKSASKRRVKKPSG
jgi:D-alanyl-D-alanine carboxypeptidase